MTFNDIFVKSVHMTEGKMVSDKSSTVLVKIAFDTQIGTELKEESIIQYSNTYKLTLL